MHLNTHNLRNQQRGFPFLAQLRRMKMEKENFNVRMLQLFVLQCYAVKFLVSLQKIIISNVNLNSTRKNSLRIFCYLEYKYM